MKNFHYFKIASLPISVFIVVLLLIKGLFEIDLYDSHAIGKLLLKSLFVGITVGLIMGILNMFFKVKISQQKIKRSN